MRLIPPFSFFLNVMFGGRLFSRIPNPGEVILERALLSPLRGKCKNVSV